MASSSPPASTSVNAALENFQFPSDLPVPPFIDVDGVPNFRDMGGYLLATSYFSSGSRLGSQQGVSPYIVRKGFVYRCAHPTMITEKGRQTLTEHLGVKKVFDLRSAAEVMKSSVDLVQKSQLRSSTTANASSSVAASSESGTGTGGSTNDTAFPKPDDPRITIPPTTRLFTPVYLTDDYSPAALARKLGWYSTTVNSEVGYSEGFVNAYRDIASHGVTAYKIIFRHILDHPEEPFVFHCTAGKDRTGVLGAMILRLCGVDDDAIAWEYALTELGLGGWREIFIERISQSGLGGAGNPADTSARAGAGAGAGTSTGTGDDIPAGAVAANATPVAGAATMKTPTEETDPTSRSARTGREEEGKSTDVKAKPVISRAEAATIVGSKAGNIRAFMRIVLDGELGGVVNYLHRDCGFSFKEIEQIRKNLVEPVDVKRVEEGDLAYVQTAIVRPVKVKGWTPDGGVQATDAQGEEVGGGAGRTLPHDVESGREKEEKVMAG